MTDNKSYGTVLIKAKTILDYLTEQHSGQTLKEISEGLTTTKSTTLKILNTMCELRLLWRDENDKRYYLGSELIGYGQKALAEFDVRRIAVPYLTELRDLTGETVHLGIESNEAVVFLDKLESPRSVNLKSKIGGKLNLYSSAMGKVLLAEKSEQQLDDYFADVNLTPLTIHTITNQQILRHQLVDIQAQGYSIDDRENEEEVFCVGALLKKHNRIFGAFSVSTPEYRINDQVKQKTIDLVGSFKQKIEANL